MGGKPVQRVGWRNRRIKIYGPASFMKKMGLIHVTVTLKASRSSKKV